MTSRPPKHYPHQVNLTFDEASKAMLDALASHERKSRSQVLREAVYARYLHAVTGRPCCATGSDCLCPHMHQFRPPQPTAAQVLATHPPTQPIAARPNGANHA